MDRLAAILFLACCFGIPSAILGYNLGFRHGRYWYNERYLSKLHQPGDYPPPLQFEQRFDHFDDSNTDTWSQRYFVNDTFYKTGNPVFIMIGGEGTASPYWNVNGQWITWAEEFGALALQLEHRYYGESHPTPDMSVENLKHLSSEQALADVAYFRSAMADQYGAQNSKFIIFGGSYAGNLAAWFILKYPHLADGAVATSAPVLAEVNFEEYLGVVQASLANYSATCNPMISAAVSQMDALLADPTGWNSLTSKFRLCSALDGDIADDVSNLYSYLAGNFMGVVQYNKDNSGGVPNITIETICDIMNDGSIGYEIDRYAAVNSLLLDTYLESCLDFTYSDMINYIKMEDWASGESGYRQWVYQTCTEFGYYQSSDLPGQPFGDKFPIEFWVKQCADVYGSSFDSDLVYSAVNQTNIDYGGLKYGGRKVVFPNGSIDPWHALGLLQDANPEAEAIYIDGTAHCADMYPDAPWDPPQLTAARETIRQHIATWLSE